MALIAVMRGKPKRWLPSEYHVKYNTTTDQNPPEADHCCGRGKGKPKKGYHRSNKYYL